MAMQLRGIQRLNTAATALLLVGMLVIFGGIVLSLIVGSETLLAVSFPAGFGAVIASLLLSLIIDRVKCPRCGKPFNRPEYRNWFVRQFARTNPRWTCFHCGYGKLPPDGA